MMRIITNIHEKKYINEKKKRNVKKKQASASIKRVHNIINDEITKVMPLRTHDEEKELCCSIRFYDNQVDIIQQFKKSKQYIESILVSNNPNMEIMKGDKNASSYTTRFLQLYPNNKYAHYLKATQLKEIATTVGVSFQDAMNLYHWANQAKPLKKIAIFDWDGTLSIIEGILIPKDENGTKSFRDYGITDYEIALYYNGTEHRLEYLKNMFQHLHEKGVEVYILTNNPTAACDWKKVKDAVIGPESRHNFYKVAKQIIPQLKEENILCGYETNGFKPDTFSNNEYLRHIYYRIQHWYFTHPDGTK